MIILRFLSFFFFHTNVCCGHSLEVPLQDACNECSQDTFLQKNEDNYQRIIKYKVCQAKMCYWGMCGQRRHGSDCAEVRKICLSKANI